MGQTFQVAFTVLPVDEFVGGCSDDNLVLPLFTGRVYVHHVVSGMLFFGYLVFLKYPIMDSRPCTNS